MASGTLLLLVRILLSAMFLASGYAALSNPEAAASYFAGLGLGPASLLAWAVGIFELMAGILLIVGFQTRQTAIVLAGFTLAATYLGHFGQGGDAAAAFMHTQALLKDMAVAAGMILLAIQGPGRLSVDAWRTAERN